MICFFLQNVHGSFVPQLRNIFLTVLTVRFWKRGTTSKDKRNVRVLLRNSSAFKLQPLTEAMTVFRPITLTDCSESDLTLLKAEFSDGVRARLRLGQLVPASWRRDPHLGIDTVVQGSLTITMVTICCMW